MRVLVACEYSGRVRDAFQARGHEAVSVDLLPTESQGTHYRLDIRKLDWLCSWSYWDMMVAFPPCTHLAVSGARWFPEKTEEQKEAIEFFLWLWSLPIPKIALENPVGIMSTHLRPPDQYIQPWQFGEGYTKKTGLWLKGLPLLEPTNIVEGRSNRIHMMPDTKDRAKKKSLTPQGIAEAMADQWSAVE